MKTFLATLMSLLMTFASALAVNYNLTTFKPDETLTDDQLVEIDTISNGAELTLKIRINGVKVELANPEDSTYSIRLPKFGVATAKGSADVPRGLFYIPIPNGYNIASFQDIEIDSVVQSLKLAPAKTLMQIKDDELISSMKLQNIFVRPANNGRMLNDHCAGIIMSPIGYDPDCKKVTVLSRLSLTLQFNNVRQDATSEANEIDTPYHTRKGINQSAKNSSMSSVVAKSSIDLSDSISKYPGMPIYLIISPSPKFDDAAKKLKDWKKRLGYNTIFINSDLLNQIENPAPSDLPIRLCRYFYSGVSEKWNTGTNILPDEHINFLIFGDYSNASSFSYTFSDYIGESNDIPSFYENIMSDMYGATNGGRWEGEDDLIAYSSIGRIPCSTSEQANSAVSKIIAYERKLMDSAYEQNFVVSFASEFLDEDLDGCEDTRWIETIYKWENHIDPIYGYDVPLLLAKKDGVTPLYWNSSRNGGILPKDLKYKTDWKADARSLSDRFKTSDYLFFMGNSNLNGEWSCPGFTLADAIQLDNTDNTPIVVSIASHTGRMNNSYRMLPQLLFNPNGGMVSGIGISEAVMPSYQAKIFDALATSQWSEQLDGYDFPWENGRVHNVYLGEMNRFVGKYLNTKYPDYIDSYNKQTAMTMHCVGDPTLVLPDAPKMQGDIRILSLLGSCNISVADKSDKSYSFVLVDEDGNISSHYGKYFNPLLVARKKYQLYVNDFSSIPKYYGVIEAYLKPGPIKLSPLNSTNLNMSTGFHYEGMNESETGVIVISNLQGTNVHTYECCGKENIVTINFSEYPSGVYKAVLIGENGKSEAITLTK